MKRILPFIFLFFTSGCLKKDTILPGRAALFTWYKVALVPTTGGEIKMLKYIDVEINDSGIVISKSNFVSIFNNLVCDLLLYLLYK